VVKYLSLLFIIVLIGACATSKRAPVSHTPAAPQAPTEPQAPVAVAPQISGSVLTSSLFTRGGSLSLGSFKAGTGAAANDETDDLSARIMQGIHDILPGMGTVFSLADNPTESDYVLEGYIENYTKRGSVANLSVDGEIWLQSTGEKIFVFQTSMVIDLKKQEPKSVAYQIGEAIARFMAT
jgi:hypothetical protein